YDSMKWSPTLGVGEMVNSKNRFVSCGDEEQSHTSSFRPVQQVTAKCSQQQLVGNEQEPDRRKDSKGDVDRQASYRIVE
ncbi:hypothetical protein RUM43_007139, partial [Polyplax serrata]